jgi:SAM-dependent methyltransferase
LVHYVRCNICGSDNYTPAYEKFLQFPVRTSYQNVVCRDCGFMFINPRPDERELASFYHSNLLSSGATYSEKLPGSRTSRLTNANLAFLFSNLKRDGGYVLDIGCSDGFFLSQFNYNWKRYGVEPSPSWQLAASRGIHVFPKPFEEIPPGDFPNKFDLVTCISVLEHVENPRNVLLKTRDLLRPDGSLFLGMPDAKRPLVKISEFYSPEHLSNFTEETLGRLLSSCGFEIDAIFSEPLTPSLILLAKISEKTAACSPNPQTAGELLSILDEYKKRRAVFEEEIKQKIDHVLSDKKARIGLYGAGMHTIQLLGLVNFSDRISCFFDSDPAKQGTMFLDRPVHPPEDITGQGLNTIVISSGDYQDEIYRTIRHVERHGIKLIKLYPDGTI